MAQTLRGELLATPSSRFELLKNSKAPGSAGDIYCFRFREQENSWDGKGGLFVKKIRECAGIF